MSESPQTQTPRGRLRMALLAGVASLALAGGGAAVHTLAPAMAQTDEAETQTRIDPSGVAAPFDFADLAEQVRGAVVSVQVEARASERGMTRERGPGRERGGRGMPDLFEDLPDDHPMRRFFEEFGMPFGERGEPGGPEGMPPRGMPQQSQGSGFIISEDGYIVTNNHVITRGNGIRVVLDDGSEHTAEVIGVDDQTDLAVIKIDPDEPLPYVAFSDGNFRVGEWVVAVGNPFGLGGTVTAGIISASGREIGAGPYDDFIQIDASVNRGNSGGPTFNLDGEVVGVNTAIFSPTGGNVGIAFAIPATVAVPVIEQLIETGTVSRGWLGVQIQPVTEDIAESVGLDRVEGAIVSDLLDTGPAGDAGITRGDIILSVDGEPVSDARDLARRIGSLYPGDDVAIELWRDGEVVTIDVALELRPTDDVAAAPTPDEPEEDEEVTGRLGLALSPGTAEGAERGVAIVDIDPDGEGARKGLQAGDLILEAGGEEVSTPADVRRAVQTAEERGRRAVLLRVRGAEDDAERFVALSLAGA